MREQHLRRVQAMRSERLFVHIDKAHLSDGGSGLQLGHRFRALDPAQSRHALGDRTGGHENDLNATGTKRSDVGSPAGDSSAVNPCATVGHERAAYFGNEAFGGGEAGSCHAKTEASAMRRASRRACACSVA